MFKRLPFILAPAAILVLAYTGEDTKTEPTVPRESGLWAAEHRHVGTVAHEYTAVERATYAYASAIHEYAERFKVDPQLVVSVIRAESNFNPRAVSPVGARGLMQLMPETAKRLNVRDSFNPRENIRGGVQHLAYLLERYDGNTRLAVAAYNAGEVAVDKYKGVPPYRETTQYVRVVLAGIGG